VPKLAQGVPKLAVQSLPKSGLQSHLSAIIALGISTLHV